MKILLTLFVLFFSCNNLYAKEQYLQIENIRILDSVLKYFTFEELKKYHLSYDIRLEEYGFIGLEIQNYLEDYEWLQIFYGSEDLLIHYIAAVDIEDVVICKNKQNEYVKNIKRNYLIPKLVADSRNDPEEMQFYKNTDSYVIGVSYLYDNGIELQFSCYDYGKTIKFDDQIRNEIFSPDFVLIYK